MPGLNDQVNGSIVMNKVNSSYIRRNLPENKSSSTSTNQSTQQRRSYSTNIGSINTSTEELRGRVRGKKSCNDGLPPHRRFGCENNVPMVDSKLCGSVDGEVKTVEVVKEDYGNVKDSITKGVDEFADRKCEKTCKAHSPGNKSTALSKKSEKPPLMQFQSEVLMKAKSSMKDKECGEKGSNIGKSLVKKRRSLSDVDAKMLKEDVDLDAGTSNPHLGPFLLKQARHAMASGDSPQKALVFALRAAKSFEKCAGGRPNLDLVTSLHTVAAICCNLKKYDQAISVLEQSLQIPDPNQGHDHALAMFFGYMQLGDVYAISGQLESSLKCYKRGLEVQRQALGDMDSRVGETCRYLAEAHLQTLQFDEAERMCRMALDIHREKDDFSSLEETADRRLMGLIYDTKGDYENALKHLVLASMAMMSNGEEMEVASVDCSIGDVYLALGRYDDAVFAYQKALTVFRSTKGENHQSVASVFIRLADLYNRKGKFRKSKFFCENALQIYGKPLQGASLEEIACGLTEISAIYGSMDDIDEALNLLQRAHKMYNDISGQRSTIAGIEAQMGVLHYIKRNYSESYSFLQSTITKFRACGEIKPGFFGMALNQMGLASVQLNEINEAAELFKEAKNIMVKEYGPYHPNTLEVYSNLAGTYDAMGRLNDAIDLLEFIVATREEKLGTASPDVHDERKRLAVLLKEAGRPRHRKTTSLEDLFDVHSHVGREISVQINA
ncbi:protein KINESIN LIGHT CHAIN-RELATED 1-like [Typha angustifolia]|uniref:protein KINESIN LIGHT CHAIN-RELATED 1-like n=1 Tax=Typha angustifolia TaxID=59011 RepID=UPI003C2B1A36